jgi:hypothetical protein
MRAVRVTILSGLALLAGALALLASGSPPTVALSSSAPIVAKLGAAYSDPGTCQGGETLPAGTSALRLLLHSPMLGPRVSVEVLAGARVLTGGARGPGWTAGAVTVPVKPLPRTVAGVAVCFSFSRSAWPIGLTGRPAPPQLAARAARQVLSGRVGVEYLRPGERSWWSRLPAIARQMGLGHAVGGAWVPALVLALIASLVGLSSWLAVRELR